MVSVPTTVPETSVTMDIKLKSALTIQQGRGTLYVESNKKTGG
jgi:hypothetical protein